MVCSEAMHPRGVFYIGNFFFSLFVALITFVQLSYLSSFMPVAYTGLVIAGGALVAIFIFPFMPELTARYSAQWLVLVFAILEIAALIAIVASPGPLAAVFLVAVTIALQPLIAYELDILLETATTEEGTTGRVRALFLTAWNLAALVAVLLIGVLLASSDDYSRVFIAAAVALTPFIVLFAMRHLPNVLIQYPAGAVADRLLGDKELMFAGFILAGASFAAIGFFTTSTSLTLIAFVLFASRIGAALIEGMTEGHFFRRMSEKDVNTIGVWRGIWPLTELAAPIIGSAILIFGNYQLFFMLTGGFIAIAGVVTTLLIKDFR